MGICPHISFIEIGIMALALLSLIAGLIISRYVHYIVRGIIAALISLGFIFFYQRSLSWQLDLQLVFAESIIMFLSTGLLLQKLVEAYKGTCRFFDRHHFDWLSLTLCIPVAFIVSALLSDDSDWYWWENIISNTLFHFLDRARLLAGLWLIYVIFDYSRDLVKWLIKQLLDEEDDLDGDLK